jgi:hypothetical protein
MVEHLLTLIKLDGIENTADFLKSRGFGIPGGVERFLGRILDGLQDNPHPEDLTDLRGVGEKTAARLEELAEDIELHFLEVEERIERERKVSGLVKELLSVTRTEDFDVLFGNSIDRANKILAELQEVDEEAAIASASEVENLKSRRQQGINVRSQLTQIALDIESAVKSGELHQAYHLITGIEEKVTALGDEDLVAYFWAQSARRFKAAQDAYQKAVEAQEVSDRKAAEEAVKSEEEERERQARKEANHQLQRWWCCEEGSSHYETWVKAQEVYRDFEDSRGEPEDFKEFIKGHGGKVPSYGKMKALALHGRGERIDKFLASLTGLDFWALKAARKNYERALERARRDEPLGHRLDLSNVRLDREPHLGPFNWLYRLRDAMMAEQRQAV